MENMEEIEAKFMNLVKEQFKRTGGANGLDLYGVNEILGTSVEVVSELVKKLLEEKKVVYLKPLNKWTITLPK